MAGIADLKIKNTYKSLLRVDDNTNGVNGTLETVTDGEGTESGLALSTGGVRITGTSQFNSTITVGVDDTGYDVKFFGATSGRYSQWDQANDRLLFTDNAGAVFGTGGDMIVFHDGSSSYIANTTGSINLATLHSGIAVNIGHTTSETTVKDNLTVTGNSTVTGALIGTRLAVTNLTDDASIPITATCVLVDDNGGARTGIRFADVGTAGQIIIVICGGSNTLTFHHLPTTSKVRGMSTSLDTMEVSGTYMFVSDGTRWNFIGGGSSPNEGLTAS